MFLAIVLLAWYLGRKAGWKFSPVLYRIPQTYCVLLCIAWALLIAFGLRFLIDRLHPGWIVRALSFGVGFYISSPNFGLVQESTIPTSEIDRHRFMQYFTPTAFIVSCIIFSFAANS